ncbi:hypothetical protein GE061_010744 [Apolygus lucorum]|uniref:Tudor domain-containing protein n=1 Tax=Apolygus lucorum TaxID=248454 RepID=A0A6A4KB85_APOLU|nr:hypothetical protein GE061_010744 [Apolygus lucorum]
MCILLFQKAKQNLKTSREGSTDAAPKEERIKQHFVRLHAHLEKMENFLLHQLNTSSRITSLNSAIETLTNNIGRINATLAKTKSVMKSDGFGDFQSLIHELRDLESLPCILIASRNDTDLNCLQIDHTIFSVLDEHIVLRTDDAVSYQLKNENDAPDDAIEDLPKSVSLEEVKAQLLPPHHIRPSSSNAGCVPPEYAVEKSGRDSPMVSRWSSSSSLSSNHSFAIETTQLLAPPDDLVVGITFKAFISHITSPSDFYVQRHGVQRKLESLQRELRRCGSSCYRSRREDIVYQAGQYYMTMYFADCNWSRCQLLDFVGVDEVKVLHIDFGNHQKILKTALRPLPDVLAQIPPLAVRCSIINCYPIQDNEWNPKALSKMSRMLEGRGSSSITIVRKNQLNCLSVKLYKETETHISDIGEALVFLGYAQHGPAETLMPDLEKMPKPKAFAAQTILKEADVQRKPVAVTHVVSPHEFYVKFPFSLPDFEVMCKTMFRDYTTLDKRKNDSRIVYYPAVGTGVAVANETGSWLRAIVVEMLPKKMVKIFLIDVGQTLMVEWDKLRALDLKYFRIPPQAYRCSMTHVQPKDGEDWSEEAAALIRSYIGEELRIASPEFVNNHTSVLLVHCDTEMDICINALLVRNGLAKSSGHYGDIVEYPKVPDVKPVVAGSKIKDPIGEPLRILKNPAPVESQRMVMDPDDELKITGQNGQIKIKVKVEKIVNPGKFYVSLEYLDLKYKEMFSKMNEFYKTISPDTILDSVKPDDACVVKTPDGSWKRGVVIETLDNKHVQIHLVDEASDITVSTENEGVLAKLDSEFCELFDRTVECGLGGIVPAGSSTWTLTSISEMQEFVDNYQDKLYMTSMKDIPEEKGKIKVLLFGRKKSKPTATTPAYESWPSLNHELRWKGFAKPDEFTKWDSEGNIISDQTNVMENEIEVLNSLLRSHFHTTADGAVDLSKPVDGNPGARKISWPRADTPKELTFIAKVTYVGSNCDVWIQDSKNVTVSLNVINQEASKMCEGTETPFPPIAWEVGDICLGKFHLDGKWYRSEILKLDALPSRHLVRFVDYGNEEYLSNEELRRPDGITLRPIQSHTCYFDNLSPVGDIWPANHIDEIHKMIVDQHVVISLRELGNDLLGIKSMLLGNGENALNEIISRRLGVYRKIVTEPKEDTSKPSDSSVSTKSPELNVTSKPPDVNVLTKSLDAVSLASDSSWTTLSSELSNPQKEAKVEKLDGTSHLEDSASHASPGEGACLHASPVVNWLSLYETENRYKIPEGGFQLMDIPSEVEEHNVDITTILSPDLYMMQLCDSNNEDLKKIQTSYDQLVAKMQEEAMSLPSLEFPYLYKDCCCKFEGDNMWYRAVVVHDLSRVDGSLVVQFVDYGNVQVTTAQDIRQLKEEWFSVPVQAIPCQLDGYAFRPDVSRQEAMECLQNVLIEKPFIKAVIKKRGKNLQVELFNEEGVLLYQPLIEMQHLVSTSD